MSNKVSDKILKRVYLLFGMVALLSVLILVRLVNIQYINGPRWSEEVQANRIYERVHKASRGSFISSEGDILAESTPFFWVSIDPSLVDTETENFSVQLDSLTDLLSDEFGEGRFGPEYFHDKLQNAFADSERRYLRVVKRLVDYETYNRICEWPILRESQYRGGLIRSDRINNRRHYPFGNLARITLGLMDRDRDTVPLRGLEFAFHEYLKGQDGLRLVQRMPGNIEKPLEVRREDLDGADVMTTLSVEMQDIVHNELEEAVKYHKAKYGVAILMEVETGKIRAMANYPENENRAVAYRNEPGSTFKLASMLALLEDPTVQIPAKIATGNGVKRYYDRDMRDHLALGDLTPYEAFVHSSNVAFSKMITENYGSRARLDKWFEYLRKFGLQDKCMPREHIVGEPFPIITHPSDQDNWNGTTLPWMSIGYNTQLTPLQICAFYNAVANDGQYMEPILVNEVRQGSRVMSSYPPESLRQIASQSSIDMVKKMMEGVVKEGTAKNIYQEDLILAGKTGTAQKYLDSLQSYARIYQASFCGYFPADNPRYTCYILIDEPNNGAYYGGNVAAPIFRNIAQQVNAVDLEMLPWFDPESPSVLPVPLTAVVHQENAGRVYRDLDIHAPREAEGTYVRARENNGVVEFVPAKLDPNKVPNVIGMTARDAVALLEGLGLKARLNGHGKVARQSIVPGTPVADMDQIELQLN